MKKGKIKNIIYRLIGSVALALLCASILYETIVDPIAVSLLFVGCVLAFQLILSLKIDSKIFSRQSFLGLLVGLAIATLIVLVAGQVSVLQEFVPSNIQALVIIFLFVLCGTVSVKIFRQDGGTIIPEKSKSTVAEKAKYEIMPKVLDTSIIIDGRILDILDTNFIEGRIIIPSFILREIQLISDSADSIKRARGRRGLNMLNKLQERDDIDLEISYLDYNDVREADDKLVKITQEIPGVLVTNDFNLSKVAELQGVTVLNLNNLSAALKTFVISGEELEIDIIREGKDDDQGVGYMDDGTLVIVENARELVGKKVKVSATSVLQTNTGKMIFSKVQDILGDIVDDPEDTYQEQDKSNSTSYNSQNSRKRNNNRGRDYPRGGNRRRN